MSQSELTVGIVYKRANIVRTTRKGTVESPDYYVSGALAQAITENGVDVSGLTLPLRLTTFAIVGSDVHKQERLSPSFKQLKECNGFILQDGDSIHSYEVAVAVYALLNGIPLLGFGNAERIMRDAISQSRDARHVPRHRGLPADVTANLADLNAAVAKTKYQVVTFDGVDETFYCCIKPNTYFAAERSIDADPSFTKSLDKIIKAFLSALR